PSASPRARTARYAVPPSRMLCVFGERQFQIVARKLGEVLLNGCQGETIHLSDARGFLGEEIHSAYDYLSSPLGQSHWEMAGDILKAIRGGQSLLPFQEQMMTAVGGHCTEVQQSLAWAILVESILLNERLNDDLRRVAGDPECPCNFGDWYPFYLPNPGPEARRAFIDYVECRWPIHVFAVDPVTQDQNVADAFSMRREMQLAMALAFTTGQMSAQNMTRYMRRMELDMQTIALNRTVVSFGHGRDTFGWRFYPRVQTPEFDSNLTVIHRDLLVGGPKKDHLLKKHRLEPGMRELTALVIMPSFIQHLRFDVRSDYFELTDPDDTAATMGRTLELSRKIRDLERLALHCGEEADRYRIGEMERMLARVKQLSRKMPLQTLYSQVPNENTLGGFEMFSSGVTDLSPELIDYYGEPGVVPGGETKMFLVGKNFSVHETRVIAGNRECKFDLISREIMEVTIPPNVRIVECRHKPQPGGTGGPCAGPGGCVCGTGSCGAGSTEYYVDVHLATPYGVTRHLHLPVLSPRGGDVEGFTWEPENLAATYYWSRPATIPAPAFAEGNITSIRLGDPKELRFPVPATLQPAPELEFDANYQVSLNPVAGPGDKLPANSTATRLKLYYNPAEQAYVLRGEQLYAMHRSIRASVAGSVTALYGNNYDVLTTDSPDVEVLIQLKPIGAAFGLIRNNPVLQIRLLPLPGVAPPVKKETSPPATTPATK
ncbi:MAG: hypothetical protein KDA79_23020, partial [Planctomycetaceae bacterium]|nr:hypothetical protein [Planctomycetaceae bacterium]